MEPDDAPRLDWAPLRRIRVGMHLSQVELAARAGLDSGTVARIERGDQAPAFRTVLALARALGVHEAQLYRLRT